MKQQKEETILDILGSVRLAIVLLVLLASSSIFGTIIPQGQPFHFYQEKFGQNISYLIRIFELDDAYSSWWFVALLILFSINLICCTIKRLPISIKLYKKNVLNISADNILKQPAKIQIEFNDRNAFIEKIKKHFGQSNFYKIDDKTEIYAKESGRINYFGIYILHSSILIILLGGIVGAFFGFRGTMLLLEGEKSNIVVENKTGNDIILPFEIRCNKFSVEFYDEWGLPKEFISNLTIIDNNNEILTRDIVVNKPLKYNGITIYQASYQIVPEITLKVSLENGEESIELSAFDTKIIPGTDFSLGILQFLPDVHGFPAARVWVSDGKDFTESQWILLGRSKKFAQGTQRGFDIHLTHVKEKYMTGLQVKKDPGVWIVWLGFTGLVLGFMIVFWIPHNRIWILVRENDAIIAGHSNRHYSNIEQKLHALKEKLI